MEGRKNKKETQKSEKTERLSSVFGETKLNEIKDSEISRIVQCIPRNETFSGIGQVNNTECTDTKCGKHIFADFAKYTKCFVLPNTLDMSFCLISFRFVSFCRIH